MNAIQDESMHTEHPKEAPRCPDATHEYWNVAQTSSLGSTYRNKEELGDQFSDCIRTLPNNHA